MPLRCCPPGALPPQELPELADRILIWHRCMWPPCSTHPLGSLHVFVALAPYMTA